MNRKSAAKFIFAAFATLWSTTAFAEEKITPSKVFQVTQDIILQLNRLHEANFTTPDTSKLRLELPARLPRHVIQQALNVRHKIQVLRRVNGLELTEIKPPALREVTPNDVMAEAQIILQELSDFDKAYGLPPFKATAVFEDGKTPTDVYANLLIAGEMIVQLGIPNTVPNDVYRTAMSVSQEVENVRMAAGKYDIVELPDPSIGKKPQDAYDLAFYALKGLQKLSKMEEYKIPNGIVLPKRIRKDITPTDVQQILLYCLAELSSMKIKAGATDAQYFPPPEAGQTPSTVYDQIGYISHQIQSLQW